MSAYLSRFTSVRYLESVALDEETLARQLTEHPVEQGLNCVFQTVEPCMVLAYQHRHPMDVPSHRLRPFLAHGLEVALAKIAGVASQLW